MKLKVKTFGVTRDVLGEREVELAFEGNSVGELRHHLLTAHPRLVALRSLLIAVNEQYADDHQVLSENDVVALIPPVSGG